MRVTGPPDTPKGTEGRNGGRLKKSYLVGLNKETSRRGGGFRQSQGHSESHVGFHN